MSNPIEVRHNKDIELMKDMKKKLVEASCIGLKIYSDQGVIFKKDIRLVIDKINFHLKMYGVTT